MVKIKMVVQNAIWFFFTAFHYFEISDNIFLFSLFALLFTFEVFQICFKMEREFDLIMFEWIWSSTGSFSDFTYNKIMYTRSKLYFLTGSSWWWNSTHCGDFLYRTGFQCYKWTIWWKWGLRLGFLSILRILKVVLVKWSVKSLQMGFWIPSFRERESELF